MPDASPDAAPAAGGPRHEPPGGDLPPVVAALADPGFHGLGPGEVDIVETHVSWVFLTPERAYKLRKPVVFPFLDYGSPERRREMCEQELRLGRRTAPHIYLAVRPVVRAGGDYALGAPGGEGVEHVVEMRRFDEAHTLASMLRRGDAGPAEMGRIARRLAAFHAQAPAAEPGTFGPDAVLATVGENFGTLLANSPRVDEGQMAAAHRFAVAFLHANRDTIARRSREGRVRECHGDLRADHVLFEPGREVEVFDPVEFDPALRLIDVSADLAFLVMDLFAAGAPELADELVDQYRRAGGDDGGDALLHFYAAYRAWVRVKVSCLRAQALQAGPEREASLDAARRGAALARRLAWRARRPLVLVVGGLSASGKSVLSRELAGLSGLPVISSDPVRKARVGVQPTARAPAAAYAEQVSLDTYRALGQAAADAVATGGAIVDATFRRRAHRDAFAEGYRAAGPQPLFVECVAPARVLKARALARERDRSRVSDATAEIVERQLAEREPPDEVAPKRHVVLRTDRPVHAIAAELEARLDERLGSS